MEQDVKDICAFFKDSRYFAYAIVDVAFTYDERTPGLSVTMQHYSSDTASIEIAFDSVHYHAVIPEHHIFFDDQSEWASCTFLQRARQSRLLAFASDYYQCFLTAGEANVSDVHGGPLHHYRMSGQNYFIEVISGSDPQVTLKTKT